MDSNVTLWVTFLINCQNSKEYKILFGDLEEPIYSTIITLMEQYIISTHKFLSFGYISYSLNLTNAKSFRQNLLNWRVSKQVRIP